MNGNWNGWKTMAVALAAMAITTCADASTTRIQVGASVMAKLSVQLQQGPQDLVLTEQDVSRGYVEMRDAVRFNVRSNCPYRVEMRLDSPAVGSAQASLSGRQLEIGAGAQSVDMPMSLAERSTAVTYRFVLSPAARAGTYPWPMRMVVQPNMA